MARLLGTWGSMRIRLTYTAMDRQHNYNVGVLPTPLTKRMCHSALLDMTVLFAPG